MIWKDRIKQYQHRYTLTNVSGSTYDFAEVTGEVIESGTPVNAENLNALGKEINSKVTKELSININAKKPLGGNWSFKTWTGLTSFTGNRIWTDGTNIYYSSGASQYVLDVATSTWSVKNWTGFTNLYGEYIWTDGTNIYYSSGASQYVLDVATSTWSVKPWTGFTGFDGSRIWTDGTNIYYSSGASQYVLDVATSTWTVKNWTGFTGFDGSRIWTDGTNIYYSDGANQYVLDVATSTWTAKPWTGFTSITGNYIWTDGTNIYYSDGTSQYVLIPKQSISRSGKNQLIKTISDEYQLRGSANVLTSDWEADSTYSGYGYRAAVTVANLTENHTGLINFDDIALDLGVMKDGGKTYDGGFYIYASAVPSITITIESYIFWRA